MRLRALFACCLALALPAGAAVAEDLNHKVDPWVLQKTASGQAEFLVMLREQADLRGARALPTKTQKSAFVADALSTTAARVQAPLLALLDARGVEHRSYWVANMIWVRGDRSLVEEIAAREDVFHVYANPTARLSLPAQPAAMPDSPDAIEWGVAKVRAPEVWALGYTGQGIVVAGADTGYQWDHPALKLQYRGWSGSADHNYNWHDSIHSGGGSCGADSVAPCDDFGHGTHTMGTMVGDDGGSNKIGVAPGARWIGCRNMNVGAGTPESYSECFQWFIAPTDLANLNPDPSKAPDVINNSWTCTSGEGCTDVSLLQAVVESTRAAGIEVVASAGNAGSACSTVAEPPAIYAAAFSIGATDSSDAIAGFSSRGPVTVDGSNRLKPDISAPGVNVRSSVPGDGYSVFSGTSMAGPHVVGVVALVLSGNAGLVGNPDAIEPVLTSSAMPRTTAESCGGIPGDQIPNNTYGWGRVDALSAFSADLGLAQTTSPSPTLVGVPVTFTLTVSNSGRRARPSAWRFGGPHDHRGRSTRPRRARAPAPCWPRRRLRPRARSPSGGSATVAIVGTPGASGTLTSNAGVTHSGADAEPGQQYRAGPDDRPGLPVPGPGRRGAGVRCAPDDGLYGERCLGAGHAANLDGDRRRDHGGQGTGAITFDSGDAGNDHAPRGRRFPRRLRFGGRQRARSPWTSSTCRPENGFHDFVNTVSRNGVTAGCGKGNYCPSSPVNRAQMAVFLLKAKLGAAHVPPPATGTLFLDVPANAFAADWIEELSTLGVTAGCGNGNYCPDATVTRAQMAVFLLKTLNGSSYTPPAATGIFEDVPVGAFAADWIENLYALNVTGGCSASPLLYCPNNPNTRGQMAVFLTKTFSLP